MRPVSGVQAQPTRLSWPDRSWLPSLVAALGLGIAGCASPPLQPFSTETTPVVLTPIGAAGVQDRRARFREIFCAVLDARRETLPDDRACEEALTLLADAPESTGAPVALEPSGAGLTAIFVPGIGWDCFADWLAPRNTVGAHLQSQGYGFALMDIDSLSSSAANARLIRDAIVADAFGVDDGSLVLIGYSKGAVDVLEAVTTYPEIRPRIAAIVSLAGAIGGSPLANVADQSDAALLRHWPGARCTEGDGGAVESLRPATRKAWLARNPPPADVRAYSIVAMPEPENVSTVLQPTHAKLARIDERNDSQLLFYDQIIPGGALLAYLNADHWSVAVPIARSHEFIGAALVDRNAYPREALVEAILRMIEEDVSGAEGGTSS